jgi:hypothetical protein
VLPVCLHKSSNDLMFISELGMDFNKNVGSTQYGIVRRIKQAEFGSLTIHHEQTSLHFLLDQPDGITEISPSVRAVSDIHAERCR